MKIGALLGAWALWIYGCFQFVQYFPGPCSIGDWSKTTSATVLAMAATSGWFVVTCIVLYGSNILPGRRALRKVDILSDITGSRLTASSVVRIFCSQSESYRGFVHNRVGSLKQGMTIKVLMRSDSTPGRQEDLKKVAEKWRNDISGRGVSVDVRAVAWSPVMFRGWLFDEKSAVLGWYNRVNGRTIGQGEDTFLIEDLNMVRGLAATFESVFQTGTPL